MFPLPVTTVVKNMSKPLSLITLMAWASRMKLIGVSLVGQTPVVLFWG